MTKHQTPQSQSSALAIRAGQRIYFVRNQRVMLDYDLAELYRVETRALKQAVRRNADRFPEDFMLSLTPDEITVLVSQNVIPGRGKLGGGTPMAFTEQGVSMLSGILRSPCAVQVRAFVHFRAILLTNSQLSHRLDQLEQKYDSQFKLVFDAIRQLMLPPPSTIRRQIGFRQD